MQSHRHSGPKSSQYNELETLIAQYHETLRTNRHENAAKFIANIRKYILLNGCPEDDIRSETETKDNSTSKDGHGGKKEFLNRIGHELPTIRHVEDTLRGKLWRLVLGVGSLDSNGYKSLISKKESAQYYVKIRGDTKRTFLTSKEYNSRVSEERLVRVLNSCVLRCNKPYCQGMDAIAAGLLYVMPELDAFETYSLLINKHFPTYFYSEGFNKHNRKKDLIGAYAASYLSWDILKVCDREIFNHLFILPAHTYLFPLVASFQAISQPFTQLLRLWDFLFCFGVYLNPILAAAQIISNKKLILSQPPARLLQTILSQRKWMNQRLNAKQVIDCTMHLIILLKKEKHKKLWINIAKHASNFDIALQIKAKHQGTSASQLTKTITASTISTISTGDENKKNNKKNNNKNKNDDQKGGD